MTMTTRELMPAQGAELIGSSGGYDVYALQAGGWFLTHESGSTHLVTDDDLADQSTDESKVVGAMQLDADDLDIIFDNGGGITVQTEAFVHHYDDPTQAAHDVAEILAPDFGGARDWEGDCPDAYRAYDFEIERNGGYNWYTRQTLANALESNNLINVSSGAERKFWAALTGRKL